MAICPETLHKHLWTICSFTLLTYLRSADTSPVYAANKRFITDFTCEENKVQAFTGENKYVECTTVTGKWLPRALNALAQSYANSYYTPITKRMRACDIPFKQRIMRENSTIKIRHMREGTEQYYQLVQKSGNSWPVKHTVGGQVKIV